MTYLLDTNTCIFLMKNVASVVEHYKAKKHLGISVSTITVAELYYGVYNSAYPEKNGANLANFLIGPETLEFDSICAMEYGRIRAMLRKQGNLIGPLDMLIAAHAQSKGLTLVTDNTREFERIKGLPVENWLYAIDS